MTKQANPFDEKKENRLWVAWTDQQNYKKLSEGFTSFPLEDWDKEFFIPEIWNRLRYVESILFEFQKMCADKNLALDLDARLKPILIPEKFNLSLSEPQIGIQYLDTVKTMIQEHYLDPLSKFFASYEKFYQNPQLDIMWKFLNEARFLFDVISQTKADPFTYHFKAFPSVKNLRTGDVVADEPMEVSIVLKPFEVKMNELANVCKKTSESIEIWANKRREAKKELMNFAASQTQVEVAYHQKISNKYAFLFQLLTIVFAIVFILVGDRINAYSDKSLEKELAAKGNMLFGAESQLDQAKREIKQLNEAIDSLTAKKLKIKK